MIRHDGLDLNPANWVSEYADCGCSFHENGPWMIETFGDPGHDVRLYYGDMEIRNSRFVKELWAESLFVSIAENC